jgi:drug/metabolite transporter (DMT)-like permease
VCILWGTTYLGIRIALEGFPPLYLIAIRYTISGAVLLIGAAFAGVRLPRGRELLQTAICGIICIGIGNGGLALGEKYVASGLAALIYTASPFWMVGIDALLPGGHRPKVSTVGGLLVGLLGVGVLLVPAATHSGLHGGMTFGIVVLEISVVGWVLGSLLQKRVEERCGVLVRGAVQQLAAGLAVFLPAGLFEKMSHSIGTRPMLAVAYLVIFGSFIGFSSFIYAMAKLPVAIVSIYTFVNPIVAVFLGWLFYREHFGWREFAAMLIIFGGIAIVRWSESMPGSLTVPTPEHDAEPATQT